MDMSWEEILDPGNTDFDISEPKTGLIKRQRLIVQKTWKEALKLGDENVGIALFDLYFTRNPDFVNLFKALRDVPFAELKTHPKLKAHGLTVVRAINGVIESLKDPDRAAKLLQSTGKNHVKRNIRPDNFLELQETILVLLASALGPEIFTPIVKLSWNNSLSVIMAMVMTSMKQEELDQGHF